MAGSRSLSSRGEELIEKLMVAVSPPPMSNHCGAFLVSPLRVSKLSYAPKIKKGGPREKKGEPKRVTRSVLF